MRTVLDTTEFSDWGMKKYNLSNKEWHEKIWRPFMCDYFMEESLVGFSKFDGKTLNLFEIHMNEFIKENPQLGDPIWFVFDS